AVPPAHDLAALPDGAGMRHAGAQGDGVVAAYDLHGEGAVLEPAVAELAFGAAAPAAHAAALEARAAGLVAEVEPDRPFAPRAVDGGCVTVRRVILAELTAIGPAPTRDAPLRAEHARECLP